MFMQTLHYTQPVVTHVCVHGHTIETCNKLFIAQASLVPYTRYLHGSDVEHEGCRCKALRPAALMLYIITMPIPFSQLMDLYGSLHKMVHVHPALKVCLTVSYWVCMVLCIRGSISIL